MKKTLKKDKRFEMRISDRELYRIDHMIEGVEEQTGFTVSRAEFMNLLLEAYWNNGVMTDIYNTLLVKKGLDPR